ncbi:MAG: heme-binding domain-containing protein [Candidatus Eisenbacteria bacterium]|nr:heme-binding domain-containing protein [Candidatus Eisenbacteria bacterium]
MRRTAALAIVLVAFIAIQFVPVLRENRLGSGDPDASREVRWILRRACYDCHSTETRWPIWAYVAPVSWQVVQDVDRARAVLNFSEWVTYPPDHQRFLRPLIGSVTAGHRMPLWYYLTLHPDARLNGADLATLRAWASDTTARR